MRRIRPEQLRQIKVVHDLIQAEGAHALASARRDETARSQETRERGKVLEEAAQAWTRYVGNPHLGHAMTSLYAAEVAHQSARYSHANKAHEDAKLQTSARADELLSLQGRSKALNKLDKLERKSAVRRQEEQMLARLEDRLLVGRGTT